MMMMTMMTMMWKLSERYGADLLAREGFGGVALRCIAQKMHKISRSEEGEVLNAVMDEAQCISCARCILTHFDTFDMH